jgi:hypothetical protein
MVEVYIHPPASSLRGAELIKHRGNFTSSLIQNESLGDSWVNEMTG